MFAVYKFGRYPRVGLSAVALCEELQQIPQSLTQKTYLMKQYISETIGTFAMVFCGCGAITINEITNGSISHVGVAIT